MPLVLQHQDALLLGVTSDSSSLQKNDRAASNPLLAGRSRRGRCAADPCCVGITPLQRCSPSVANFPVSPGKGLLSAAKPYTEPFAPQPMLALRTGSENDLTAPLQTSQIVAALLRGSTENRGGGGGGTDGAEAEGTLVEGVHALQVVTSLPPPV